MSAGVAHQRWQPKPEVEMKQRILSFYRLHDINETPKATLIFIGCSNRELVWTFTDIGVGGKSKIAAISGNTYDITRFVSFYTRYSNEIPKAIHIFGVQQLGAWDYIV